MNRLLERDRTGRDGGRVVRCATLVMATAAAALLWQPLGVSASTVSYPNFLSTAGLTLNGDAAKVGKVLRLTPALNNRAGSAFTKRRVVDPKRSFKTQFRFNLHQGTIPPGDGMAFVLHRQGAGALCGPGGGLGYCGIAPSVVVEFDIFQNLEGNDPNANHVAVMRDGDSADHLVSATPKFQLYGGPRSAWIDYSAAKRRMKIYVKDGSGKPAKPLISVRAKLNRWLDGKVRAGFTAATGGSTAAMEVVKWKLSQRSR